MDNKNSTKVSIRCGMGFGTALQLALIILKLCGVITWKWVVVLIPLWIELGFIIIAVIALLALYRYVEKIGKET